MHNITDFLKIGAGIVFVIALIVIGFNVFHKGDDTVTNGLNQYDSYMNSIEYQEFIKNEGNTVLGSQVVEALENLKSKPELGLTISVKTKANASSAKNYTADSDLSAVKNNKSGNDYINPTGTFSCTVTKNSNGIVTTITYVQQ